MWGNVATSVTSSSASVAMLLRRYTGRHDYVARVFTPQEGTRRASLSSGRYRNLKKCTLFSHGFWGFFFGGVLAFLPPQNAPRKKRSTSMNARTPPPPLAVLAFFFPDLFFSSQTQFPPFTLSSSLHYRLERRIGAQTSPLSHLACLFRRRRHRTAGPRDVRARPLLLLLLLLPTRVCRRRRKTTTTTTRFFYVSRPS